MTISSLGGSTAAAMVQALREAQRAAADAEEPAAPPAASAEPPANVAGRPAGVSLEDLFNSLGADGQAEPGAASPRGTGAIDGAGMTTLLGAQADARSESLVELDRKLGQLIRRLAEAHDSQPDTGGTTKTV